MEDSQGSYNHEDEIRGLHDMKMKRFVYKILQVKNICVLGKWIKLQAHEIIDFLTLK
jgi:hypothetical protein